MTKKSYHAHTKYCNHAIGDAEEIINAAIKSGFKVYGISEHVPYKHLTEERRTTLEDAMNLKDEVNRLKEKYKDEITIYFAFECEALPQEFEWYKELAAMDGVDYLVFGNHYEGYGELDVSDGNHRSSLFYYGFCTKPEHVISYGKSALKGMELGVYKYLAHPDVFIKKYGTWDATCTKVAYDICRKAKEMNMPLGFNVNGMYEGHAFPHPMFWEIAKEVGNDVLIEMDSHDLDIFADEHWDNAYNKAIEWGLNVIDGLKI